MQTFTVGPVKFSGRPASKEAIVVSVAKCHEEELPVLRIRIDDPGRPEFWLELVSLMTVGPIEWNLPVTR